MSSAASIDYISIPEFFKNRSIFITGGTGFMGKVLIEKLLRSCPGIKNLYLLMRPKKGEDIQMRLKDIIDSPVFKKLREERSSVIGKICLIRGNVAEPHLGISESDQNLLIKTVSVVFHLAATVKFNEALKLSLDINVSGTKKIVDFCLRIEKLEALIHASTVYCNCEKEGELKETIFPTLYDPQKLTELIEWMDGDVVDAITPILIGNRPNTYTFTKALAEQLLMNENGKLPIAIVRPSIVLSSMKEPVPGWIDNWNGPSGFIAAASKGLIRTVFAEKNMVADLVPVDLVINLIIAAAWRVATTRSNQLTVYNCCTGIQNSITWGDFLNKCLHWAHQHPFNDLHWYPSTSIVNNWFLYKLKALSFQTLPAYLIDSYKRLTGKKTLMIKSQNKLDQAMESLSYFSVREWRFNDDNVKFLNSVLSKEDRQTFYFDVSEIDWEKYLENYILGLEIFICKGNISSPPASRKQIRKLLWIHRFFQLAAVVLVWKFVRNLIFIYHRVHRKIR